MHVIPAVRPRMAEQLAKSTYSNIQRKDNDAAFSEWK
jgi:hypothetical protein